MAKCFYIDERVAGLICIDTQKHAFVYDMSKQPCKHA